jgi:deoxyribodipyrimidine photolyase-related protein
MTYVTLIFPHQLFDAHPCIEKGRDVYLIEECLFFKQYHFHQQKLVLHRASMKKYAHFLSQQNLTVNYIDNQKETLFSNCVGRQFAWL